MPARVCKTSVVGQYVFSVIGGAAPWGGHFYKWRSLELTGLKLPAVGFGSTTATESGLITTVCTERTVTTTTQSLPCEGHGQSCCSWLTLGLTKALRPSFISASNYLPLNSLIKAPHERGQKQLSEFIFICSSTLRMVVSLEKPALMKWLQ